MEFILLFSEFSFESVITRAFCGESIRLDLERKIDWNWFGWMEWWPNKMEWILNSLAVYQNKLLISRSLSISASSSLCLRDHRDLLAFSEEKGQMKIERPQIVLFRLSFILNINFEFTKSLKCEKQSLDSSFNCWNSYKLCSPLYISLCINCWICSWKRKLWLNVINSCQLQVQLRTMDRVILMHSAFSDGISWAILAPDLYLLGHLCLSI